jgi:hypothetical protein
MNAIPWLLALAVATGTTLGTTVRAARGAPAQVEPFKVRNIHFETNASACDMGVQIRFDTDGITKLSVTDPSHHRIYSARSAAGMKAMGGQTEGFLEGVEPQIPELVSALGCAPSTEEGTLSLSDLLARWPEGDYTFTGSGNGSKLSDHATLTHHIPAGPMVSEPDDGTIFDEGVPVLIDWNAVTDPILPSLGPVTIVGYHVIVEEAGGEVTPSLDVDLPAAETSLTVPPEFLKPATVYRFEVLSTEESGNQTITEGFFCTPGVADCVVPD